MQEMNFRNMISHIYNVFGREMPSVSSSTFSFLRKRVEEMHVPDEAAMFIAQKFEDYQSLPMNLTRAIKAEFYDWLSKNPDKRAKQSQCRECGQGLTGFFYAIFEGKQFICKCPCNDLPEYAHIEAISAYELNRRGWERSSGRRFSNAEHWAKQYEQWQQGQEYEKPRSERNNVHGVIGHQAKERAEHAKVRSEYEHGMW